MEFHNFIRRQCLTCLKKSEREKALIRKRKKSEREKNQKEKKKNKKKCLKFFIYK